MQKKGTSLLTAVDRSGPLAAFTKLISLEFAEEVSILGFYSTWKKTILITELSSLSKFSPIGGQAGSVS